MAVLTKGISVLVVEDNPGDYVLIEEYLREEAKEPEIHHTETLEETIELFQHDSSFDAILLDLTLPDANGEALVERVMTLCEQTPVIVLTGYENQDFGLKTLNMGIADYLLKDELTPFLLSKSISYSIERARINRSLKKSEKKYRDIFNLSPQPMWVYDLNTLAFLDVNKAATEHYGYSREEFCTMTLRDIRPKENIPNLEEAVELSHGKDEFYFEGVFQHITKGGKIIDVEIKSNIIEYQGHKAEMVLAEDVTDRLQAEQQLALSEQRFKSLVQDGSDMMAILDEEANYIYVAPTVESVLDFSVEELTGTNAFDYIHEDDQARMARQLNKLENKQRVEIAPFRFRNGSGEWRWVETVVTNVLDNPAVEGLVVNSRDVTDAIEREKELQESLERYEYVSQATDDVIYDWDIVEDLLTWDASFSTKFLDDVERYTIKYWAENVHPEDIERTSESLNRILDDPSTSKWEAEYRFKKKDGAYATVFERGFIVRDDNGEAVRMIGTLQDITERKEYEAKLEELSLVAAKTTDIIIMTDAQKQITWVNSAFEELTGYTLGEVKGRNPGNFLQGPDTNPHTIQRISKALDKRNSVQEVILNYSKSGEKYWLDLTIDPIFDHEQNCTGFIAIEKDVTEQIERQRKLRESVERYESVAKATSDTIWDLNLENDTIEYNQNIYNMFGYDKGEVKKIGKWWRNNIHPEDLPEVNQTLNQVLSSDKERFQLEYRFEAADGSYKNIYDRAFVVSDNEGNPIRIIGAMQDVTQQKEEEQWLKLFESAIATTNESVVIIEATPTDLPGRKILYVNNAFSQMTGYSREEALGQTLHFLNGPKTSVEERKKLNKVMGQWEPCQAELINYKKDGEEFWIQISMAPVQDSAGLFSHWICVGRDVTEQKEKETQLRESLKETETLLLEIHHRVKNNLAVVSGMMQLQAYEEADKRIRQKLFDSVTRIQTMGSIHELLYKSESFSKLDFDQNIKKLVSEITDTFQSDIVLNTDFDLQEVNLNINQAIPCSLIVNEVVTNIMKHAFPKSKQGTMSIEMSEEDERIYLKIADNGQGLPDDFDNADIQSSLGLKLIDTLAKQLGGDYGYQTIAHGTAFTLTFNKADVKGIGSAHLE